LAGVTGRARRAERIEWLALAAAIVPFAVAVVRAAHQDWMPIGDAAYFTVRSRDVLTSHNPLLGAWSSGSAVLTVPVNNLGPMQLDLLAPFTKAMPYLGTAIGSASINVACIVAVWYSVRRLFGPMRVVWVMAGTMLFLATLGLSWLIDARQQYAMVLPFYALLWVCAAMWTGASAAVPIGLALGTLTVQTHFTYAYQGVIVTFVGVVGWVIATWSVPWRQRLRTTGVALGVMLLLWLQPLIDQMWETGNLGNVLGPAREGQSDAAGLKVGIQILAGGALEPPFWLPGSIGRFLQPHDGITLRGAIVAVAWWMLLCGALLVAGIRVGHLSAVAAGAACLAALGGGLVAAASIPPSMFGLVPQNYYWVWSIGAFLTIAAVAGWSTFPLGAAGRQLRRLFGRRELALVGLAALFAVSVWPRYPVDSVRWDETETDRLGRPLRDAIHDALRTGAVDDIVEVDLSRAFFANNYPFVMLTELQRAGIEFRFPPDNRNLLRFGESRCAEAGRYQRLLLISGRDPALAPGATVIAEVVAITDDELAEYLELQAHFGDLIRDGTVSVHLGGIEYVLGEDTTKIEAVMNTPGMRAGGLARSMDAWRGWDFARVPPSEQDAFERWLELEKRSSSDYQTVVLENPAPGDRATC
jgi:hypothetical protein